MKTTVYFVTAKHPDGRFLSRFYLSQLSAAAFAADLAASGWRVAPVRPACVSQSVLCFAW